MQDSFYTLMLSIYIIIFTVVQIGILYYGGLITETNVPGNQLYYMLNFNDMGMGMNTLFCFFIGNNWQNIAQVLA